MKFNLVNPRRNHLTQTDRRIISHMLVKGWTEAHTKKKHVRIVSREGNCINLLIDHRWRVPIVIKEPTQ